VLHGTAEDAKIPFIPPFLQPGQSQFLDGSNFASGGAGALVETFTGLVCIYALQPSLATTNFAIQHFKLMHI